MASNEVSSLFDTSGYTKTPPKRKHTNLLEPVPGNGDFGAVIYDMGETQHTQVAYSKQFVSFDLNFGEAKGYLLDENKKKHYTGIHLYAPTFLPPDDCPVEVVTAYRRFYQDIETTNYDTGVKRNGTVRRIEFYDWYLHKNIGSPIYFDTEYFKNNFVSYNKTVNGKKLGHAYEVMIEKQGEFRRVFLYNYANKAWAHVFSMKDTGADVGTDGWNMWETWYWHLPGNNVGCKPTERFPTIRARDTNIYYRNSWRYVAPWGFYGDVATGGKKNNLGAFPCADQFSFGYDHLFPAVYSNWYAQHNFIPQYRGYGSGKPTPTPTPTPTPAPTPTPVPTPKPTPRIPRFYSGTNWTKTANLNISGATATMSHVKLTATDKARGGVAGEVMWANGKPGNWLEVGYHDGPSTSPTVSGRCIYWAQANADRGRYQDFRVMTDTDAAGDKRAYRVQRVSLGLGFQPRYAVYVSDKNAGTTNWKAVGLSSLFNEVITSTDHGLEVTALARGTIAAGQRCAINNIAHFIDGEWWNVNGTSYAVKNLTSGEPRFRVIHDLKNTAPTNNVNTNYEVP